jgi:MFS family permease
LAGSGVVLKNIQNRSINIVDYSVSSHENRMISSFAGFWKEADDEARKALLAAAMGWLLDAFDVMLYALILKSVIEELGLTTAQGGLMASLTLGASAIGGLVFGVIADKLGRTRALSLSILLYSVFTFACGLAQNLLAVRRVPRVARARMGGEWRAGATLVSETWPEKHRGQALGIMQSCWAIGYGLARSLSRSCLPRFADGARCFSPASFRRSSRCGFDRA